MSSPPLDYVTRYPNTKRVCFQALRTAAYAALSALLQGPVAHQASFYAPGLASATVLTIFTYFIPLFQLQEPLRIFRNSVAWLYCDEPSIELIGQIWADAEAVIQYFIAIILIRITSFQILLSLAKLELYALFFSATLFFLSVYLGYSHQTILIAVVVIAALLPALPLATLVLSPNRFIWVFSMLYIRASVAYRSIWQPYIQSGGILNHTQYARYIYPTLPTTRSIRLLRIHSRRSRTLHCALEIHSLDEPSLPIYDAMSYCWGHAEPTHAIILHSMDNNQDQTTLLQIPLNAYKVLADRSSVLESRLVWLDYICINQNDVREKGFQIPLMREIYGNSRRTIAWVGDSLRARHAGSLLQKLYVSNIVHVPQEATVESVVASTKATGRRNVEAEALRDMLKETYFFRKWMVQEIALAPVIDVRYGNVWFDWAMLVSVCKVIGDPTRGNLLEARIILDQGRGTGFGQVSTLARFRDEVEDGREVSLVHLLSETAAFGATQKEDHVFSLVAISAEKRDTRFLDSFGRAPADVYTYTTRLLLEKDERLSALHFAGIGYERENSALPSWVPDYGCLPKTSTLQKVTNKRFYAASASTKPSTDLDSLSNRLSIQLLVVDHVAAVSQSFLRRQQDEKDASETYQALYQPFHEEVELLSCRCPENYPIGTGTQSQDEAMWRTLIGNCVHPMTMESDFVYPAPISLGNGYNALKRIFEFQSRYTHPNVTEQPDPDTVASLMEDSKLALEYGAAEGACSYGRRFAVTKGGRMAMVPPGTVQNDLVVVFLGAETPFLVRKADDDVWMLVGECYVHGLMNGEAVGQYPIQTLTLI